MERGWVIFDRKRRYIPVVYKTEVEAREEMWALLHPYPDGHEWRRHLHVDFVGEHPLVQRSEPPYGYRHENSRHGVYVVEDRSEQHIVRFVRKMLRLGDTPKQLVVRLNAREWRPRHGDRFTIQQVDELLEEIRRRYGKEEGAAAPTARAAGA